VNPSKVAVIDVGSNTIKLLVAQGAPNEALEVVHQASVPTRIGSGIGCDHPALADKSMKAGIATIEELLDVAESHSPDHVRLVATGAVRDASNGKYFATCVKEATGHLLAILSGHEEASGIAAGLLTIFWLVTWVEAASSSSWSGIDPRKQPSACLWAPSG
jgi:exopolyphosphatase/guanosine-5'-triphosphate,3'-diphosphate pyrophosphatase